MTELWPFSQWQGRRQRGLQEASLLEKHNRVLSEALPKGPTAHEARDGSFSLASVPGHSPRVTQGVSVSSST